MSPKILRLRLRELREAAGLSQDAVASALGTRRARISDLETGAVQRVDGALLAGLCRLFGVEPGALFAWHDLADEAVTPHTGRSESHGA